MEYITQYEASLQPRLDTILLKKTSRTEGFELGLLRRKVIPDTSERDIWSHALCHL